MVDGNDLRSGMRVVPTPVTVVTAASNGQARGATIGSFSSVSLDPPLVCFNIARDAKLHEVLEQAAHLVVHVLRDDQAEVSNFFANRDRSSKEQFEQTPHTLNEHGIPVLTDALTVFSCNKVSMLAAGDSSLVLAHVTEVDNRSGDCNPLIFYNRGYYKVGGTL